MILVTGANGMVGSYLKDVFDPAELILTDVDELDIIDRHAVEALMATAKPDCVLHLAAATNVDQCELEPDLAFKVNAVGTLNMVLGCRLVGARMVYISTAAVFNGQKREPYTEFDRPDPINHYARSKYAGEKIVRELIEDHIIVRTGWLMGGGPGDHKFVGKIVNQLKTTRELKAVNDKRGCPTYAPDLLTRVKELIDGGYLGIYNAVNSGSATRFEIVEEIVSSLGLTDATVQPVNSDMFPAPATRPDSEVLDNYKTRLVGLQDMRTWREALGEYLAKGEFAKRLDT